jgi:hypothetical protein
MDFPSKPFHVLKRGPPTPENAFLTLMQNPDRTLVGSAHRSNPGVCRRPGQSKILWIFRKVWVFESAADLFIDFKDR